MQVTRVAPDWTLASRRGVVKKTHATPWANPVTLIAKLGDPSLDLNTDFARRLISERLAQCGLWRYGSGELPAYMQRAGAGLRSIAEPVNTTTDFAEFVPAILSVAERTSTHRRTHRAHPARCKS